ncbi:hypothetical protein PPSIR1_35922 [Plesiocystis pacifica SIR-1]|uniref:Uncharacterized protein n=2 Tax=Plesiocystis pacifica TaxID=191768 RepID=A6G1W3_9BACT|nr:hypothetical protein PPSIR1_35922 [Plesiocystis pacifica SIR-1]
MNLDMKTRITAVHTALLMTLTGAPVAMASTAAHAKEYKVKINNTSANKWKVKWICKKSDGSTKTIDADTYPSFSSTKRTTNVTSSKCSTGDWWIQFYYGVNNAWFHVPFASLDDVVTQKGREDDFNSSEKMCMVAYHNAIVQVPC